jgi:hypothetical protein
VTLNETRKIQKNAHSIILRSKLDLAYCWDVDVAGNPTRDYKDIIVMKVKIWAIPGKRACEWEETWGF